MSSTRPTAGSPLADPTLGDVDQAVDDRHESRQISGVDATLGKTRAEEFEQFAPFVDVARFGPGHRNLDALLDDTDGLLAWRVVGLPCPVPARR